MKLMRTPQVGKPWRFYKMLSQATLKCLRHLTKKPKVKLQHMTPLGAELEKEVTVERLRQETEQLKLEIEQSKIVLIREGAVLGSLDLALSVAWSRVAGMVLKRLRVQHNQASAYHAQNTWEPHLERIRDLFTRLVEATLTVNLAKCEFPGRP
ncbi:unnamed protein product [Merluccius merluccius]